VVERNGAFRIGFASFEEAVGGGTRRHRGSSLRTPHQNKESHEARTHSSPFLVALAGCSKPSPEEQKKNEEKLAAALASAMAAPAASSAPSLTSAAAPATAGAILATCNNPTDGKCKEFKGVMGIADEDSCKSLGGTFKKDSTPCSHDKLLGSCAQADTSLGLDAVDYFYKADGATADGMKSLCEGVMSGKWTAAPKGAPAAPAAKAAAKGKK
jgi:hypothetical protein